jgi:hypothetical protein
MEATHINKAGVRLKLLSWAFALEKEIVLSSATR